MNYQVFPKSFLDLESLLQLISLVPRCPEYLHLTIWRRKEEWAHGLVPWYDLHWGSIGEFGSPVTSTRSPSWSKPSFTDAMIKVLISVVR